MPIVTQQAPLPTTPTPEARQPATTEQPPAVPAATEPKVDQLSPKFAALARKEKALRSLDAQLKAREEAFKAKEADYASSYLQKKELAEKAKSDPLGILSDIGLTPDEFTQALLNSRPEDHAIRKLSAEISALRDDQTKVKSQFEEQQTKAYEQAVNQIRTDTKLLVDADSNYETVKAMNATEAVVELIKTTFDEQGLLLSVEDAAKEVEAYLIEEALKMAQLKKVQEKLTPKQVAATPAAQKSQTPQQPQMKTLTNAVSATIPQSLSDKERKQRAILAFRGELK